MRFRITEYRLGSFVHLQHLVLRQYGLLGNADANHQWEGVEGRRNASSSFATASDAEGWRRNTPQPSSNGSDATTLLRRPSWTSPSTSLLSIVDWFSLSMPVPFLHSGDGLHYEHSAVLFNVLDRIADRMCWVEEEKD